MAWREQKVVFLLLAVFTAWLLAGSLNWLVAGLTNSGILEFGSLCCQVNLVGRVAVCCAGCSGLPRWYRDTRAVGNHLLILPGLVHIKEQPRSTQNPFLWGDAALPFHKDLHLLMGFRHRTRTAGLSKAPRNGAGWALTPQHSSSAPQLSSPGAGNKAQRLFPNPSSKAESL